MLLDILNSLDEGILVYDKDLCVIFMNKSAKQMLNVSEEGLSNVPGLFPYFSLEGKREWLLKGLKGKPHYMLVPFVHNCAECRAEIQILPVEPHVSAMLKIKPITPHSVTNSLIEKLKQTDERLRCAQKLIKIGTWIYDPSTGNGEWSEESYEIFGLNPAEGVPTLEEQLKLVHPADRYRVFQAFKRAIRCFESYDIDFRVVHPNGEIMHVHSKGEPICDVNKKILYVRGTFANITEKKRLEDYFNHFFTIVPDLLCLTTMEGNFLRVNPACEKILGYCEKEIIDKSIGLFLHPKEREQIANIFAKTIRGQQVASFELRFRTKKGDYKWLHCSASAMPDAKLVFIAAHDISYRYHLIEELQQHSLALEEFITQINHELFESQEQIKNANILLTNGFVGSSVVDKLSNAYSNIKRTLEYIESTLSLVKNWNKPLKITSINLKELLGELILSFEEKTEVPIRHVIHSEGKKFYSDALLLQELFKQLIQLSIQWRKVHIPILGIWINADITQEKAIITYQDNSNGIPEEFQECFNNFKTYPRDSTQLGLYIVHQIVEKLQGNIEVHSTHRRNIRFVIQISNLKNLFLYKKNGVIIA
ncbi:MAG: PAS domain-containing protein [Cytophagales bacterium]|nr:PAS domain-containing protein [Cytophagales bacterium]MDW8384797.1 PAS domain-containing protein [Flammeovirgaceae bacterium]